MRLAARAAKAARTRGQALAAGGTAAGQHAAANATGAAAPGALLETSAKRWEGPLKVMASFVLESDLAADGPRGEALLPTGSEGHILQKVNATHIKLQITQLGDVDSDEMWLAENEAFIAAAKCTGKAKWI